MDVNEHERLSNITIKTQIKVNEQLVVREDMDVNEHERLSNITLRHKFQQRNSLKLERIWM
jgi:predicted rRNA methylase YqxC with S4 and FtsJ domains